MKKEQKIEKERSTKTTDEIKEEIIKLKEDRLRLI